MLSKPNKMSKQTNETNTFNIISQGTVIKGDVDAAGDIRIDGEIFGNVNSQKKILINQTGKIEGNLQSENCEIAGKVKGKIEVKGILSLKSTAVVEGELLVKKIAIEPGAIFNGTCKMTNHDKHPKS